jgi:hypothetical protein
VDWVRLKSGFREIEFTIPGVFDVLIALKLKQPSSFGMFSGHKNVDFVVSGSDQMLVSDTFPTGSQGKSVVTAIDGRSERKRFVHVISVPVEFDIKILWGDDTISITIFK